jgi:hypothetical protein
MNLFIYFLTISCQQCLSRSHDKQENMYVSFRRFLAATIFFSIVVGSRQSKSSKKKSKAKAKTHLVFISSIEPLPQRVATAHYYFVGILLRLFICKFDKRWR